MISTITASTSKDKKNEQNEPLHACYSSRWCKKAKNGEGGGEYGNMYVDWLPPTWNLSQPSANTDTLRPRNELVGIFNGSAWEVLACRRTIEKQPICSTVPRPEPSTSMVHPTRKGHMRTKREPRRRALARSKIPDSYALFSECQKSKTVLLQSMDEVWGFKGVSQ
jgi:hypothetical protein